MLERYVLFCIGKLSPKDDAKMETLSYALQRSTRENSPWPEVIRKSVGLPPDIRQTLMALWTTHGQGSDGNPVSPEEFARAFVEANLPTAG
jgi:hypothetical protein